jgi:hypothetical protein
MITDARPENQAKKEKPIKKRPFIASPELSVDHI